uniref:VWFA domain-containing protein n=1 Tax=Pelodiscus sinensis TaxID=13735 RepID=K7GCX1_PELSI
MKMLLTLFLFLIGSQTSVTQTPASTSADIVLLVDSSSSLGDKTFPSVKAFISKTIGLLTATPTQYRIALAQYSDDLHLEFQLDTHKTKNAMLNHVKKNFVFKGGSVRTGNALQKVHSAYFKGPISRRDKNRILVVLTSGKSEDDVEKPANDLKSDGVKIIALGMPDTDLKELQSMATPRFSQKFRTLRDLSMFPQNMTKIIESVIQPPPDVIQPFPDTKKGEVCMSNFVADVVFIVDEGVSIPQSEDIKQFLQNAIDSLDVQKDCVQIGLVTYSSKPRLLSLLSEEMSKTAILEKIKGFSPREGKANIGAAINATRKDVFSVRFGSRKAQRIEQIAILITHRPSEDNVSEAALGLRKAGVTVFTVGVENADDTQLTQIASHPPQLYVTKLMAFSDLPGQAETLQKKLLNQIQYKMFVQTERRQLLKAGCMDTEEADIYLLIDGSTSIHPADFTQIKDFLKDVIKMFNIGPNKVRFGAVQYSHIIDQEFEINEKKTVDDLEKAIDNIRQIYGDTYIGEALTYMQPLFKEARNQRPGGVPCYLIVLTDGESHDSVKEPAEQLRNEKINIYAVGVKGANEEQLHEIAGSKSRTFFVQEFDALKTIKNEIVQGICTGEACREMRADIMFLVDSSGSIGQDNFSKMKSFMKELVKKSDIGADRVQVGVVQFSGTNQEEFQLNRYSSKSDIFSAIDGMSLMGDITLTGGALTFVSDYFKPSKGARPGVKKFLILITDGVAGDEVKSPAEKLQNQGVVIFSVGVFNANKTQLEEISGKRELVFYVEKFDILKHIEDELIFGICSPSEECKRIERLDVVFVIDESGSISREQYETMKEFMITLVKKSDVAPDRVQFGAVKYSDEPTMLFYLNEYNAKSKIVEAIQKDTSRGGSTYTAKAIAYAESLFAKEHGSRKDKGVPQILIVITDGVSHDTAQLNDTAKRLRDKGIIIYAVGIKDANSGELLGMAGSEDKYFYVDTFEGLKNTSVVVSDTVCDDSKPECEIKADLVFLIDGSTSIDPEDFVKMKTFLEAVIDQIFYEHNVQVGIAQYSHLYKKEVNLGAFPGKSELKAQIQNIEQITGNTLIGSALTNVKEFFAPSGSKRVTRNVRPILLVLTDGESQDNVAEPAENLRKQGVDMYAIGVGNINDFQLMQIAGAAERKYTVDDFSKLTIIKNRLVNDICHPVVPTTCFVDIVVGFDISSQQKDDRLFAGQFQLETYLPDILKALTSLSSLSCNVGTKTQSSVAVYLINTLQNSSKFQIDSEKILNILRNLTINKPSYLNSDFLESLWKTFTSKSDDQDRKKVLLVFSDGLDEDVEKLEQKSEELRKKGLNALITVVLERASNSHELQYIEFGRGSEYNNPLTIDKQNIANALALSVRNMAERICCSVPCMCIGDGGATGHRGGQGDKGAKGIKGHAGYLGEDGEPGLRGLTGLPGKQGIKGCEGSRGLKGYRGISGQKGNQGDNGIDGVNGEQGSLGHPGIKGEKGDLGNMGNPGPRGPFGDRGEKGFRGDPGNPGLNHIRRGPKGSKGDWGRQGEKGPMGSPGSPGPRGTPGPNGRRGAPGLQGEKGKEGPKGSEGEQGFRGSQGLRGIKGVKGENGREGNKGLQGNPGTVGPKGSRGNPGIGGNKGEPGDPGQKGPRGPSGQWGMQGEDGNVGYGRPGKRGAKGQDGFPGETGLKGEIGDAGISGEPGPKGSRGKMGVAGFPGEKGIPGGPGPQGRRGRKGTMGLNPFQPCELIDYLRKNSPCWEGRGGKPECPVYPTELVFALDISQDVTSQLFERMREIVTSVVNHTKIRESNCPVGARVAIVSYNSNIHYLIRFSEFYSKNQLLTKIKNLAYERSSSERNIVNAMRFVAKHIFKRTLPSPNVRKIAVFFSNGPSVNEVAVNTAVLEYSAFDIVPVVIAFNDVPVIRSAFMMDDTGLYKVINIDQDSDYVPSLEPFRRCTLCYDKCNPDGFCERRISRSPRTYVDAAFILDSSQKMSGVDFEKVKNFLSRILDNFDISSNPVSSIGDRVAVVSHAPPDFNPRSSRKSPVKEEFNFVTYNSRQLMKRHIQGSVQQLNGPAALGHAIRWTIDHVFSPAPHLRQHKVIIVISAGETSQWDKETLKSASLRAKCQGYSLLVISLGHAYNHKELEELASIPTEQHLIELGRVHKPELDYVVRFMKPFVHLLRRAINEYPPEELKRNCTRIRSHEVLKPVPTPRGEQVP